MIKIISILLSIVEQANKKEVVQEGLTEEEINIIDEDINEQLGG